MNTLAQRSDHLEPTENYDYRINNMKGANWVVEIESTSTYTSDGIPKSLSSRVKIEEKRNGKSRIHTVTIPKYQNEDGVAYIDVDGLDSPLFLVISKGGLMPDTQREIHLISPKCSKPIDSARAQIEDASQIQIDTGVKDFMISFSSPEGASKKTWTAPVESSKLCQQKWR